VKLIHPTFVFNLLIKELFVPPLFVSELNAIQLVLFIVAETSSRLPKGLSLVHSTVINKVGAIQ